MTDHLQHACGGTWEPISGWTGRYRCSVCRMIGYRKAIVRENYRHRPEYITPYACGERGCKRGAVRKVRRGLSKVWRCSEHSRDDEDRF